MFNALENNGHIRINRPDVKVWKNQMAQGWASRIVELEIDKQRYIVICSFDGLEIFETYKKEEYEKLLAGPTAEQSQFQVNSPLRQIEVLQKKLQEKDKKRTRMKFKDFLLECVKLVEKVDERHILAGMANF